MTDDQIKHMVDRFLQWRLPSPWRPDGGISFERFGNEGTPHQYERRPVGTNLFDATQAEAMVRFMVGGLAAQPTPPGPVAGWRRVPVEPTEAMEFAGNEAASSNITPDPEAWFDGNLAAHVYRAMLAAAPPSALPPEPPVESGWLPTHRHVKRGTDYQVVGTARIQSAEPLVDNEVVLVYRDHDASLDSTDVARNHNRPQNTARAMADRWDAAQCPATWTVREPQRSLFGDAA